MADGVMDTSGCRSIDEEGPTMMMNGWSMGSWMTGMGLIWLLVVLCLVLGAAALVKYLMQD